MRSAPLGWKWFPQQGVTRCTKRPVARTTLLPAAAAVHRQILASAERLADLAGFQPVTPPTFEQAELFIRGVGEGTDIVEKEMYIFEDRGG